MNGKQFYDISIRGRIAYVILCFENYVKVKYSDIDMHPVLKMMWSVVDSSDYIDNSAYRYLEIVPECLFEKDYYSTVSGIIKCTECIYRSPRATCTGVESH